MANTMASTKRISGTLLWLGLLTTTLGGCGSLGASSIQPSTATVNISGPALERMTAVSPTETLLVTSPIPTQAPTATSLSILTPTFDPDQRTERIERLLDDNAGCDLPCWWGIVPGETTWQEAENLLAPLAIHIQAAAYNPQTVIYTASFSTPADPIGNDYLIQNYVVKDALIERLWVRATKSSYFSMGEVIGTYGPPGEVLVRTFRGQQEGVRPMYLVFMYPDLAFAAIYAANAFHTGVGDLVEACWEFGPELFLWSPSEPLTFHDLATPNIGQIPSDEVQLYRPWDYATSESLDQFLAGAGNPNQAHCLQTQAGLWP
jgi:hypothetical protein